MSKLVISKDMKLARIKNYMAWNNFNSNCKCSALYWDTVLINKELSQHIWLFMCLSLWRTLNSVIVLKCQISSNLKLLLMVTNIVLYLRCLFVICPLNTSNVFALASCMLYGFSHIYAGYHICLPLVIFHFWSLKFVHWYIPFLLE